MSRRLAGAHGPRAGPQLAGEQRLWAVKRGAVLARSSFLPADQARLVIRKSAPGQGPTEGLGQGSPGWVQKEQLLARVKLLPEEGRATE